MAAQQAHLHVMTTILPNMNKFHLTMINSTYLPDCYVNFIDSAYWFWLCKLGLLSPNAPWQRGIVMVSIHYTLWTQLLWNCAAANDKVYPWLTHGRWFSVGTPATSTTKTGRHDIAEILLKVALIIKPSSPYASNRILLHFLCCFFLLYRTMGFYTNFRFFYVTFLYKLFWSFDIYTHHYTIPIIKFIWL
jgi:hypothetical protein